MRDEIGEKEQKNIHKLSQKRDQDCCIQTLLHTYKN